MGCWDVFCLLCGNPCHGMFPSSADTFLENIEWYEKIKDSKDKRRQFWRAELKPLYDYWIKNPDFMKTIKEYIKITKWMDDCTFLTVQNKISSIRIRGNAYNTGALYLLY